VESLNAALDPIFEELEVGRRSGCLVPSFEWGQGEVLLYLLPQVVCPAARAAFS
jgi:hypothetical protein